MSAAEIFGSDTVIGAALMAMGITSHEGRLYWPDGDTPQNVAKTKKQFATLFRHGTVESGVVIVVGGSGLHYGVSSMDDLLCVWSNEGILRAFDMTAEAFRAIEGDVVLSALPGKKAA